MKKSIYTLVAAALFGACTLAAQAQPAVKLCTVDLAKLYDGHYKTVEKTAQLQSDQQKAQEEIDRMRKEIDGLVEEYKALDEQTKNPALTPDAKSKAQNDAQKKVQAIQAKQNEGQTFVQNSGNALQQRLMTFRSLMLEEISKTATTVAQRHGATILIDKSGPSGFGVSNLIYSDPAYDITDEVAKEINKDRPAAGAAPTTSAAPTDSSGAPSITVPGVTPKK